jgi:hypothetical protein
MRSACCLEINGYRDFTVDNWHLSALVTKPVAAGRKCDDTRPQNHRRRGQAIRISHLQAANSTRSGQLYGAVRRELDCGPGFSGRQRVGH